MTSMSVAAHGGVQIGIDIGGTKIDAVAVEPDGAVLHRHTLPAGQGNEALLKSVIETVKGLQDSAGSPLADLAAVAGVGALTVGIGAPGRVHKGRLSHAVNLGITEVDLAGELAKSWGVRPVVANDVNAATLGAWTLARGEAKSIAFLNVGTGLASGVVFDGKLWSGSRGAAGEIGYVVVDPNGPKDRDGVRGRLETYASGGGIAYQWHGPEAADQIMLEAFAGDTRAQAIREGLRWGVAQAVRILVLTLDVDAVIIGGGLVKMRDELRLGVEQYLESSKREGDFIASLDLPSRVVWLEAHVPVAAVGAAMLGAAMPVSTVGRD